MITAFQVGFVVTIQGARILTVINNEGTLLAITERHGTINH